MQPYPSIFRTKRSVCRTGYQGTGYPRTLFEQCCQIQILNYLLYHRQFLAHQLAQELMISEATLSRHISRSQIRFYRSLSYLSKWPPERAEHESAIFISASFAVWSSQDWGKRTSKIRKKAGSLHRLRRNSAGPTLSRSAIGLSPLGYITQQRLRVNPVNSKTSSRKCRAGPKTSSINACIAEQMISLPGLYHPESRRWRNDDFLFHFCPFPSDFTPAPWNIYWALAVKLPV